MKIIPLQTEMIHHNTSRCFIICIIIVYPLVLLNYYCPSGQDLPYPIKTKRLRQYNRCIVDKIPYITSPLETAQHLLYSDASIIRFGDADIELILGWSRYFQNAETGLAEKLTTVFEKSSEKCLIGLYDAFSGFQAIQKSGVDWWMDAQDHYREWIHNHCNYSKQYFSAVISSPYMHSINTHCFLLEQLYNTLRSIWAGKDIVLLRGDNNQKYTFDVYDTAKSQVVIYAPRYQAWKSYSELKLKLVSQPPEKLYILSCGPVGKVIAYDLINMGRRALDLGHLAKDYNIYRMNISHPDQTDFYYHD